MKVLSRVSCLILGCLLVSCASLPPAAAPLAPAAQPTAVPAAGCTHEQLAAVEAVVTGLAEAIASRDADKAGRYYADDVVFWDEAYGDNLDRKDEVLSMYAGMLALPDIKIKTTGFFVSADCSRAAAEWTWTGTKGGKPYSIRGLSIEDFRDGKVAREVIYYASFSKPY